MKTVILRMILVGLVCGVAGWFFARKMHAEPQLGFGQPLCIGQVPAVWGDFKGGTAQSFVFQDSAGTLRFVTSVPCGGIPQVALEVHRVR
jgi:hypothetical protein